MLTAETIIKIDPQGRFVLPKEKRGRSKYFTCQTEKDGTIHLIPLVGVITPKQAYFWSKQWQKGEKEASGDLDSGKYKIVNPENLENYLDTL